MKLTIIRPVFDEEAYLAPTLDSIRGATDYLRARSDVDASVEVIVVDNDSQDETAAVARQHGALK